MTPTQHLAAFETEADILSLMLCKPDQSIPKVRAELVADDFFRQTHRVLYACLLEMYQEHEVIDITTVVPYLQSKGKLDAVGGVKAVSYIYSKALGVGALGSYMATVKERARRRKAIELMDVAISQAADLGEELDLHSLQSDMAKVASERYMAERTMKDMTLDFLTRLEERSHEDPGAFCVMSGLNNLDMLIHGFRKQELIYIAGRPSMGKSALAILIAVNAALRQDKDVLYVSLEMGEDQLLGRAIAADSGQAWAGCHHHRPCSPHGKWQGEGRGKPECQYDLYQPYAQEDGAGAQCAGHSSGAAFTRGGKQE